METIYNIPQLIDLIKKKDLTTEQICKILEEGFSLFADENKTPPELIKDLETYWSKYRNSKDQPLFIDSEIEVNSFLEAEEDNSEPLAWKQYKTTKATIIASLINSNGLTGSKENNTFYLRGKPVLQFI